MLTRLIVAAIGGWHSAADAANAIRTESRHRAQIMRFLARYRWSNNWETLRQVSDLVLQSVLAEQGTWVFIVDQTHHTTRGQKAQNTYHCRNKSKRPKHSQRRQKKTAPHSCHTFVCGLLLSPETGTRLPCVRSYYTKAYCRQQAAVGRKHGRQPPRYRSQPDLAAEMIRDLRVPEGARVLVIGDTSFEAQQIRDACAQRRFDWLMPANPERVLAGEKPRRKLTNYAHDLSRETLTRIELCPDATDWRQHQRGSKSKARRTKYTRLYWAHSEIQDVHHVGTVRVVFSTTKEPVAGQRVDVQKILLTNLTDWETRQIVAAYAVRWQIELFFKEMKSFLGLSSYRFRDFVEIEGWVQACFIAFVYLEWYRLQQPAAPPAPDRSRLRVRGLTRLVLRDIELADLQCIAEKLQTPEGRDWLQDALSKALPLELRKSA